MNDIAFKVIVGNGYDDIIFKTIMLKGEKGDRGEAGGAEIDDSTTTTTTTWSSTKINTEILALPKNFSELRDVQISAPADDQAPVYDATAGKWKNKTIDASTLKYNSVKSIKDEIDSKASNLTELDDVNISNPQNNQGFIYDSATGKWKNGNPSISGDLDDLDDVNIDLNTLADGQAVKWDAQQQKWVNGAVSTTSALVDLTDVALDSPIPDFSSLVYNATLGKWKNKQLTIACTEAQYNTWKNASPSQLIPCTHYVLTDADNLNATADDIEYSSGVSVADELNNKANASETYTKSEVDDLLPSVVDVSNNVTLNNAFATPDYKKLYKYGKVCHLMLRAKLNSNLANNVAFATIPANCAPKGNDYAQVLWYGDQYSTINPLNCYFGSWDNSLHNLGSVASGKYVMIDCKWITV